ncbi:unnamed protein product [Phytophthora fragariaefolia]|uniref:Unnamed protein product n=1 Tax=Phytophthora fragariaefolia TaxID=1490495 RepID=A0A9W6Y095_9STRA|nr:unnamed protein product [Phytophthora fragariaefolia]
MLGAITYGTERYDSTEGLRRAKYHEWFEARKNKAFSALALSLSVDLRTTFKIDDIRDNMDAAAMLLSASCSNFEADDGINPDYLLQELVTRWLKAGETVTAYVDDVARKVALLHQANGEFTEWQHASLLLPNCVEVYQGLVREHGDWINIHVRKSQTGQQASQALRVAQVSAGQGQDKDKAHPASAAKPSASEPRMWQTKSRKQIAQTVMAMATAQYGDLRPVCRSIAVWRTRQLGHERRKPYPPPSPIYSPSTPAESDDDDDHANVNEPSTPQQLQLQPTVPERQVQQVQQVEHATPAVQ